MSITPFRANLLCLGLLLGVLASAPARSADLALPLNASPTHESSRASATYIAPIAPYAEGLLPAFEISGRVTKQAFRVDTQGVTPQQLLAPVEDSLAEAGFEFLFKCEDRFCGGFDFRFATDVITAPDMFVDLFDYTFLTAKRDAGEYITVLTSRDATAGYIQIIQVTPEGATLLSTEKSADIKAETTTPITRPGQNGSLAEQLETVGRSVLTGLAFNTGSSDLGEAEFASLKDLAAYLSENPTRKVALVGHTDSVGSLSGNITLSKRRAASVRQRLISAYNIAGARMEAEGMGYLSPLTSNLTEDGREENRRVEVILLNTE
ncbi:OmpA family protein [Lentibacter algarum]|uniref:OmpA family protein n=1 Tax=Lentibacter algarum TaxID=576131 RepID=UPI001C09895D|nr:OmpA family protein [Lentibacter algarum]MBU2983033.1 OmpA family protein [Lentibacter algarum]